jgi:hypothetical protein
MRVAIHEAVDKSDGVVFRCTLSGPAADRWLEVPAWMFDRAACPHPPRLTASPFVSMGGNPISIDAKDVAIQNVIVSALIAHFEARGRGLMPMRQADAIVKALKVAGYEIKQV